MASWTGGRPLYPEGKRATTQPAPSRASVGATRASSETLSAAPILALCSLPRVVGRARGRRQRPRGGTDLARRSIPFPRARAQGARRGTPLRHGLLLPPGGEPGGAHARRLAVGRRPAAGRPAPGGGRG